MTDRSSSAYLSSVLHAGVIALILILAYSIDSMRPQAPKIFELRGRRGRQLPGATAAPALGSADGIKLATPAAPVPLPPAPAVAEAVPAPRPGAGGGPGGAGGEAGG